MPSARACKPPVGTVPASTIGGIDEAGRGPLAGPVIAAIVVLHADQHIDGVRDSKQLTARRREVLFDVIRRESVGWSIGRADVDEIDALNILHATMLAMQRAVAGLERLPARLRVDGNRTPAFTGFAGTPEAVVGGDGICPAIGAASIIAKVERDRVMQALDADFPQYGFARHKGYPTAAHRAALADHGPCPQHRRSFAPVRAALRDNGRGP